MRRATWARHGDTETYTVDVTAPAPTVTLTSNITADDIINAAEAGGNVAHHRHGGRRRRRRRHRDADGERRRTTPARCRGQHLLDQRAGRGAGGGCRLHHRGVDQLDGCGGQRGHAHGDTETYTVDVTAPAPTITLTSNITADDVINAAEAGGNIAITGTVGGDADDGDTVTLTVNGTNYTGTVCGGRLLDQRAGRGAGGGCRLHHPGVDQLDGCGGQRGHAARTPRPTRST